MVESAVLSRLLPRAQLAVRCVEARFAALASTLGVAALPDHNRWVASRLGPFLWLGPDEFLLLTEAGPAASAELTNALADRGAIVDLSAGRVELELRGAASREVLSAGTAIDLHPRVFGAGSVVSTLLARVPVILFQIDEVPTYRILVRPSFEAYLTAWLRDAIAG